MAVLKVQMTGASSATRPKKIKKDYSQQHLQLRRIQKRVEEQNQYGGFYKRPGKSVSALAHNEPVSGLAQRKYNHYYAHNSQMQLPEATLEPSGAVVVPRINPRTKETLQYLHDGGLKANSTALNRNQSHLLRQTSHEERLHTHGSSTELHKKKHALKNM